MAGGAKVTVSNPMKANDRWYPVIGKVLQDTKYTKDIYFHIPDYVQAENLANVGKLIAARKIQILAGDVDELHAFYRFRGEAVMVFDRRSMAKGGPRWFASVIIHEAVHVDQDLRGIVLDVADWEAAAFIAQAICLRNIQGPTLGEAPIAAALLIADKVRVGNHSYETELNALRAICRGAYGSGIATGDKKLN
jgi:hypothetical protein